MRKWTMRTQGAALCVGVLMSMGLAACGDAAPTAVPTAAPTKAVSATATTAVSEATAVPTKASSSGDWKTFTSADGGFSIDMPGEPEASNETAETALGEITFYFYQVASGDAQYAVSYNDYPVDIAESQMESVLGDAIKGAAQGNEVKNQKTIDIQGHTAVTGEMTIQDTAHVWYTGVVSGRRLYQIIFYAPEASYTDYRDEAQKFVDSFKITNP